MKTVYVYDKETKLFLYPRLLADDDNTIIENSTEKPVPEGLWGKIKWTGQDWIGQTREEYEASLPKRDAKPSAMQQTLNVLGQQVATLTAENQQLKETLKSGNEATQQLGMQVATLIAKDSTTNGGTN